MQSGCFLSAALRPGGRWVVLKPPFDPSPHSHMIDRISAWTRGGCRRSATSSCGSRITPPLRPGQAAHGVVIGGPSSKDHSAPGAGVRCTGNGESIGRRVSGVLSRKAPSLNGCWQSAHDRGWQGSAGWHISSRLTWHGPWVWRRVWYSPTLLCFLRPWLSPLHPHKEVVPAKPDHLASPSLPAFACSLGG